MNEQWLFLPTQLVHLMNKTITTYLQAPEEVQRLVNKTYAIQGRYGDKYVFQLSHGTQQIKRYEPHKYRNDRNSPLRQRVRDIMALAWQNPEPNITERLHELHRNYPYYLLRTESIKLRMKNFHFDTHVRSGESIRIYQAVDPEHPNPELDILYAEENFAPKREIVFEYAGEDEQYFYGVKARNGELSNVLNFIWGDELPEPQRRQNNERETVENNEPLIEAEPATAHIVTVQKKRKKKSKGIKRELYQKRKGRRKSKPAVLPNRCTSIQMQVPLLRLLTKGIVSENYSFSKAIKAGHLINNQPANNGKALFANNKFFIDEVREHSPP